MKKGVIPWISWRALEWTHLLEIGWPHISEIGWSHITEIAWPHICEIGWPHFGEILHLTLLAHQTVSIYGLALQLLLDINTTPYRSDPRRDPRVANPSSRTLLVDPIDWRAVQTRPDEQNLLGTQSRDLRAQLESHQSTVENAIRKLIDHIEQFDVSQRERNEPTLQSRLSPSEPIGQIILLCQSIDHFINGDSLLSIHRRLQNGWAELPTFHSEAEFLIFFSQNVNRLEAFLSQVISTNTREHRVRFPIYFNQDLNIVSLLQDTLV